MRRLFTVLWVVLLCVQGGLVVAAERVAIRLTPDKSFYRPGDTVTLDVETLQGSRVDARITFLTETVAEVVAVPVVDGHAVITWAPPADAPRGYGITVTVYDEARQPIASEATAFDVLNGWIEAPRYGFLSQFTAGRADFAEVREWLLRHHINGIQFYDWQYRWEDLLPDTDNFVDGIGRPQSMTTVLGLVDTIRAINVQAMPYTAIYGASAPYLHVHPDWGLYDANGEINRLGEDLIVIFDPTPGSPWNQHLLAEFADVLDNTPFDGIHIDQYGSPKNGFDAAGNPVDLAEVFPQFIAQAKALVDEKRGDRGTVIFNLVGNWPVETVAPVNPDATYIEVWAPYEDYNDLIRIIANAQRMSDNKPVIIAAYIAPENVINWRLANAAIFASGAYHIETGEPGGMLQHPYFPNFGPIPEAERDHFQRYYDFIVRYENVLSLATVSERANAISLGDIRTRGLTAQGKALAIARAGETFETFSLVNFVGIDSSTWNGTTSVPPTPLHDVAFSIEVTRPVKRVWTASPDGAATMDAAVLDFTVDNGVLRAELPAVLYWSMIVVEYVE